MPGEPNEGSWNSEENPPKTEGTKTEAEIRAEVEADLQSKLASALEGSEAYKALQRAMSRADRETKAELSRRDAQIAALQAQLSGQGEGVSYLSRTLMANLPDDERAKVEADLRNQQAARTQAELAELRKMIANPPQQFQQADDSEIKEQIAALEREVVDALEDIVKGHGLDPKDKALDYGSAEDKFAVRARKLNQTIAAAKKAKEDADLEAVRQKGDAPQTRLTSGAAPSNPLGKSYLERGAEELMESLRRQAQKR